MIITIVQVAIVSFIFIYLVHYLFVYLTESLTTPKIKYFEPSQTYASILDALNKSNDANVNNNQYIYDDGNNLSPSGTTSISDLLGNDNSDNASGSDLQINGSCSGSDVKNAMSDTKNNMKDELKNFMKQQIQ